ncbi:Z1 domain-containing protein [Planktomarina sp.]|nr:Z1 domain-containing protein [Planktomarina sp.]
MRTAFEKLKNSIEMDLFDCPTMTGIELRRYISELNMLHARRNPPGATDDEIELIAKEIEAKNGVKAGLGAIVDGDDQDFKPWLDAAKANIVPYYWERYKKLLLKKNLPRDVITTTDQVTDEILGRLGNPNLEEQWDRRGLVVGHVQSGKTANYTGVICKAADAGYRLIIVIAGIHNNLRNQTQERIDEGMIGFDTGKQWGSTIGGRKFVLGVGEFDSSRRANPLTTRFHDFSKIRADGYLTEIGDYIEPAVLVVKKNASTLANILQWLKDTSARGDSEMIDQPMLLIDDEADNASINTKYNKKEVTTTNRLIRELLNTFHRSCYVGYTATPFANIFIDSDEEHEMLDEDLFPKDFIIGLDAPSNYFGGRKVFVDGLPEFEDPKWVRYIDDNEDVFPVKHPQDFVIEVLPESLIKSVRAFVLTATIRSLRGQGHKHCSMLVNASFRNPIQKQLQNRIHEVLQKIQNAVRVNGATGVKGLADPELAALRDVWKAEFSECYSSWDEIQTALHETIAAAKVVLVNRQSKDSLDYNDEVLGQSGKKYIAVGGYALSRGLTLEGLTVTWLLRNTQMYDTLMQMGRWFGYRDNYEDLCRIWMPAEAVDWYAFIANATEELHSELFMMQKAKATPEMFGLAVRTHPASLLVTARNKMGSARRVTMKIGLSNRFIETAKVSIKPKDLEANAIASKVLISKLTSHHYQNEDTQWGKLIRGVPVEAIDDFLAGWRNEESSIHTDPRLVRDYIRARKHNQLKSWDVLIRSLKNGEIDDTFGIPIKPQSNFVALKDLEHEFMSFSGKGMRVATRGIEKAGVDESRAAEVERLFLQQKGLPPDTKANFPDKNYRAVRENGLLILFFVRATPPQGLDKFDTQLNLLKEKIPSKPVVAWGVSFPGSLYRDDGAEFLVNSVKFRELFGEEDVDDDLEVELATT